jgi:hypothetical protein
MKHLMKNKQSKDMSDKKENKDDSKPTDDKRIKDDSKSTGDIKENKDEEKSHSESEAAESKDNDVVEFEKTWNVDFEELKKKNSERQ